MKVGLILLSVITLLFSCRKDDEIYYCDTHKEDCVKITDVKNYFFFKEGSYWVYEEEGSGILDSVHVTQAYSDSSSFKFDVKTLSSYDSCDYHYWPKNAWCDSCLVEKDRHTINIYKSKIKLGDSLSGGYCFMFYPYNGLWMFSDGGDPWGENNVLEIKNVFDTLQINGMQFSNVICFSDKHTVNEGQQETRHYYCSGIGLVKKELVGSSQTWNLKSYNIVN